MKSTTALVLLFYATVAAADLYCYKLGNATICEDGHYEYYCYELGNQTICEKEE